MHRKPHQTLNDVDNTLTALSDPTRRAIVELLSRRPYRAGELAEALDMSAPAMSRHLRILHMRGLVEDERTKHDARLRVFRLRREPLSELTQWLENVAAFWNDQLTSFKTHIERRKRGTNP